MNVDYIQSILTAVMPLCLVCYAITTGVMYFAAKRRGYNPVGIHVKSKLDINLNLRFLSDMRKNYIALGKPKVIPFLNFISFYGLFICFLLLIATEFIRYY